jgi:polysaccharide deacetylase family protein (PEP-CTERM system associated)
LHRIPYTIHLIPFSHQMPVKNILTVDVEDWFHVCGVSNYIPRENWNGLESRVVENTRKILEILGQAKTKATFFVLGSVAERHSELVKEINNSGHEIATHGYTHKRVYTMNPDSFREDLRKSVAILNGITGGKAKGFRAPEWSIREDSLWALDILLEEGFVYDSSMAPLPIIGNPEYPKVPWKLSLEQGDMWEFPPLVGSTPFVNFPFGGGWGLRTFPYRFIRSAIKKNNSQGIPAVMFLHPREFDPSCPRIKLPFSKRFVLNAGLQNTGKRLNRLLEDFEFTSVRDFLSSWHPSKNDLSS